MRLVQTPHNCEQWYIVHTIYTVFDVAVPPWAPNTSFVFLLSYPNKMFELKTKDDWVYTFEAHGGQGSTQIDHVAPV